MLTLPSGWRIRFGDNVNFIFETHELIHASPATISRMGIVNLRYFQLNILQYYFGLTYFMSIIWCIKFIDIQSASDLSEQIVFDSWCAKQSDPTNYGSFVQQCIVKAFDWLQTKSIELSKIGNICNILAYTNSIRSKEEFCVRLIYCLGYALEAIYQNEIATKVRTYYALHTLMVIIQFIMW